MKDLILFPGDATFQKVEQSAWGRTYVLKFSSSNQRHFVSYSFYSSEPRTKCNFYSSGCRWAQLSTFHPQKELY